MYWNEAEELGFEFTGATWDRYWDKEKEEKYKKKAMEIKKNYNGTDFRIVTGRKNSWLSNNSKALMGNEIFNKVYVYLREKKYIEERVNNFNDKKLALQKEYEEKLKRLEEGHQKDIQYIREMELLKK